MSGAAPGQAAAQGVGMMLLGILLFALNDALGKWLVGAYAVGQIMLLRSVSGLAALSPALWRAGPGAFRRAKRPGLQVLRGVLSAAESSLFFWALVFLPLADVMTYYMAGPIYVTALSALLLGERVGWRRWTAVAIGFGGVVLALHPSAGSLSPGAGIALLGSLLYAGFIVTTRRLASSPGAVLMTSQLLASLLLGAALVLVQGWTAPSGLDLGLMLLLGIGSLLGNLCVNRALRLAPASVVMPYQYTLILWGILFGALFFGDGTDWQTLLGAGVIVGAGLFILIREQRLRRS